MVFDLQPQLLTTISTRGRYLIAIFEAFDRRLKSILYPCGKNLILLILVILEVCPPRDH